jgi:hypothetical protein
VVLWTEGGRTGKAGQVAASRPSTGRRMVRFHRTRPRAIPPRTQNLAET